MLCRAKTACVYLWAQPLARSWSLSRQHLVLFRGNFFNKVNGRGVWHKVSSLCNKTTSIPHISRKFTRYRRVHKCSHIVEIAFGEIACAKKCYWLPLKVAFHIQIGRLLRVLVWAWLWSSYEWTQKVSINIDVNCRNTFYDSLLTVN